VTLDKIQLVRLWRLTDQRSNKESKENFTNFIQLSHNLNWQWIAFMQGICLRLKHLNWWTISSQYFIYSLIQRSPLIERITVTSLIHLFCLRPLVSVSTSFKSLPESLSIYPKLEFKLEAVVAASFSSPSDWTDDQILQVWYMIYFYYFTCIKKNVVQGVRSSMKKDGETILHTRKRTYFKCIIYKSDIIPKLDFFLSMRYHYQYQSAPFFRK
jgi:hypothetical protein